MRLIGPDVDPPVWDCPAVGTMTTRGMFWTTHWSPQDTGPVWFVHEPVLTANRSEPPHACTARQSGSRRCGDSLQHFAFAGSCCNKTPALAPLTSFGRSVARAVVGRKTSRPARRRCMLGQWPTVVPSTTSGTGGRTGVPFRGRPNWSDSRFPCHLRTGGRTGETSVRSNRCQALTVNFAVVRRSRCISFALSYCRPIGLLDRVRRTWPRIWEVHDWVFAPGAWSFIRISTITDPLTLQFLRLDVVANTGASHLLAIRLRRPRTGSQQARQPITTPTAIPFLSRGSGYEHSEQPFNV